jgi:hypothetical protein
MGSVGSLEKLEHEWQRCPTHGDKCPNVAGRRGHMQPLYGPRQAAQLDGDTETSLVFKLANESRCPPLRTMAYITLFRRLRDDIPESISQLRAGKAFCHKDLHQEAEAKLPEFFEYVQQHFWHLLRQASRRTQMSMLETYADHGTPPEREAALAATVLIRMLQMTTWLRATPTGPNETARIGMEWRVGPHSIYNTVNRMRWAMLHSPEVACLTFRLLRRDRDRLFACWQASALLSQQTLPAGQRTREEAPETVKMWMDNIFHQLQPTSMSAKYAGLYADLHESKTAYGSRTVMPPYHADFLKAGGAKDVLDFGSGKNLAHVDGLNIIRYDPGAGDSAAAHIPRRPFDGLVSYDVMEHVPEEDLPMIYRWWKLFQPDRIAAAISTRTAVNVLSNKENAHCTVRSPAWWLQSLQRGLPGYRLMASQSEKWVLRVQFAKRE